jgi:hypothetical protein
MNIFVLFCLDVNEYVFFSSVFEIDSRIKIFFFLFEIEDKYQQLIVTTL